MARLSQIAMLMLVAMRSFVQVRGCSFLELWGFTWTLLTVDADHSSFLPRSFSHTPSLLRIYQEPGHALDMFARLYL